MTWLDWSFIAVLAVFIAIGARLGSLWTAACLGAGFVGALLADTYALPVAGWVGTFPGANLLAYVALFLTGVVALLVPGLILSKIFKGLVLGVADSLFGLLTGVVTAFLFFSVVLLAVVPMFPAVESTRGWRESVIVRRLQINLESLLGTGGKRPTMRIPTISPQPLQRAGENLKGVAGRVAERVKG